MSDKKPHTNTDQEFDCLMNQAFLELDFNDPKNASVLNAVADQVMGDGKYNQALKSNITKTYLRKFNLNTILIIIGISAAILTPILMHTSVQMEPSKSSPKPTPVEIPESRPATGEFYGYTTSVIEKTDSVKFTIRPVTNESLLVAYRNMPKEDCVAIVNLPVYTELPVNTASHLIRKINSDSGYAFPKLTEKEIKANAKQKARMIDQVVRYNKTKYLPVQQASFSYQGIARNINKFYLQTTEVCNLDYRTFLFDLLIQGRKAEFIKAKPDQQKWMTTSINSYAQAMTDNYFSVSTYDSYPVVNISREGAEMYCQWLTEEANKKLTEKAKPLIRAVLPSDAEWTYAASTGMKDALYPWSLYLSSQPNYDVQKLKATNSKGCFLANLCLKKYAGTIDSVSFCNTKPFRNAYTTAGLMLGEGTITAPVSSYNPNDFGFYCMCGNVAEMVYVTDDQNAKVSKPGTKGGSWNSDEKHIQLNSEDEYAGITGPSPYIGFRVMIQSK